MLTEKINHGPDNGNILNRAKEEEEEDNYRLSVLADDPYCVSLKNL